MGTIFFKKIVATHVLALILLYNIIIKYKLTVFPELAITFSAKKS